MRDSISAPQVSHSGLAPQPNTYGPSFPVPQGRVAKYMFPFAMASSTILDNLNAFIVVPNEPSPPAMAITLRVSQSFYYSASSKSLRHLVFSCYSLTLQKLKSQFILHLCSSIQISLTFLCGKSVKNEAANPSPLLGLTRQKILQRLKGISRAGLVLSLL